MSRSITKLNWWCLLACSLVCFTGSLHAQEAEDPPKSRWERFMEMFRSPPPEVLPFAVDTAILQRLARKEKPNVTERYSRIYRLIHSKENAYYRSLVDSSYTDWGELHDLRNDVKYLGDSGDTIVLARNIKVLGWHPHWMGDAYKSYNYKLLSHVSLFSYNVNTTGSGATYDNPGVINAWQADDFDMVELAHADDCKVLITITNFGETRNRIFLGNPALQDQLIEDVFALMEDIEADGIDVDFEEIPKNHEKQLSDFIKKLKAKLKTGTKEYLLTLVLPKIDEYRIYKLDTLQKYVDIFTLTGYDFTTGDFASGPIAPLYTNGQPRGRSLNIEDVVFSYLEAGLDRKKLLLGLPYYGGRWSTLSGPGVTDSVYFDHLTYSNIRKGYRGLGPPRYDLNTWSAVYEKESNLNEGPYTKLKETLWYDDSLTLSVKYDWVLENGLGGVGVWALGYDQPFNELWGLIDDKFAPVNDTIVYYQPAQTAFSLPMAILKYRDLIVVSGLFVFVFLAIGFTWAIFDWRVREVFFQNRTMRTLYIVGGFSLVTATFAIFLVINPDMISKAGLLPFILTALAAGLAGGAFLVWFITKRFNLSRNKIP